jgi:hypothetical protein
MFYLASKLLHLAIFGLWLGGEAALWRTTSGLKGPPGGADPARLATLDALLALTAIPLIGLAVMPAVGYQLGVATGDIATSMKFVTITWVAFGGWALAAGFAALRARNGRPTGWLEKVVFGIGILMVPAFSYDCWDAIFAESHIKSGWVALKVQVYALLIVTGLWRFRSLARLRGTLATGADPAPVATQVRALSLAGVVLLLVAATLAVFRPQVM